MGWRKGMTVGDEAGPQKPERRSRETRAQITSHVYLQPSMAAIPLSAGNTSQESSRCLNLQ